MSHTIVRAFVGLAMLCAVTGSVATATPAPPRAAPARQIRVTLDVIQGFSSRLLCLTPSVHGEMLVAAAAVPRRSCLSARDWAARHVIFADE